MVSDVAAMVNAWTVQAMSSPVVVAVASPATGVFVQFNGHLTDGKALEPSTPLYAASVTKQFIAALAALSVAEGALTEATSLSSVVGLLPPWADAITLSHLVHHTSGIVSTAEILGVLRCSESELDNDLVLDGLRRCDPPAAAPGTAFSYNNVGYVCLAEMLRRAHGCELPRLAADRLFSPLALSSAQLGGSPPIPLSRQHVPPPATIGDGGLWISTQDLLRWLQALNDEALGTQVAQVLQTPSRLRDGSPVMYAWGCTARPSPRGVTYTHGGDWPGWTAKTVRHPASRTSVALMSCGAVPQQLSDLATALCDLLVDANQGRL